MKKLILLVVTCIVIGSCEGEVSNIQTDSLLGGKIVYEFNYKNYDYIQFGATSDQSIVHNPECSNIICKNK